MALDNIYILTINSFDLQTQDIFLFSFVFFSLFHLYLFGDQAHPRDRGVHVIRNTEVMDTEHLLLCSQITEVTHIYSRNPENLGKAITDK